MSWVRIGRVARALGLEGYLGISGTAGGLARLERLALRKAGGEPEVLRLQNARAQGKLWAVRLEGVTGRTAAEQWVGAEVLARRADLGDAGPGRHFWGDLDGLPVVTVQGRSLGHVAGLYETGGVDVLVVKGSEGEHLVPLAPYVTVERDRIVVDPPDGLLELSLEVSSELPKEEGREKDPRQGS